MPRGNRPQAGSMWSDLPRASQVLGAASREDEAMPSLVEMREYVCAACERRTMKQASLLPGKGPELERYFLFIDPALVLFFPPLNSSFFNTMRDADLRLDDETLMKWWAVSVGSNILRECPCRLCAPCYEVNGKLQVLHSMGQHEQFEALKARCDSREHIQQLWEELCQQRKLAKKQKGRAERFKENEHLGQLSSGAAEGGGQCSGASYRPQFFAAAQAGQGAAPITRAIAQPDGAKVEQEWKLEQQQQQQQLQEVEFLKLKAQLDVIIKQPIQQPIVLLSSSSGAMVVRTATAPPPKTASAQQQHAPTGAQPNATLPAPQPSASFPALQPSATPPSPQPSATLPAPQPSASFPALQPSAPPPDPQSIASFPAPQPSASFPALQPSAPPDPQPSATLTAPQPSTSFPALQPSAPPPDPQSIASFPAPQPSTQPPALQPSASFPAVQPSAPPPTLQQLLNSLTARKQHMSNILSSLQPTALVQPTALTPQQANTIAEHAQHLCSLACSLSLDALQVQQMMPTPGAPAQPQQHSSGVHTQQQPIPAAPNSQQPIPTAPNSQQPIPAAPDSQQPIPAAPNSQQPHNSFSPSRPIPRGTRSAPHHLGVAPLWVPFPRTARPPLEQQPLEEQQQEVEQPKKRGGRKRGDTQQKLEHKLELQRQQHQQHQDRLLEQGRAQLRLQYLRQLQQQQQEVQQLQQQAQATPHPSPPQRQAGKEKRQPSETRLPAALGTPSKQEQKRQRGKQQQQQQPPPPPLPPPQQRSVQPSLHPYLPTRPPAGSAAGFPPVVRLFPPLLQACDELTEQRKGLSSQPLPEDGLAHLTWFDKQQRQHPRLARDDLFRVYEEAVATCQESGGVFDNSHAWPRDDLPVGLSFRETFTPRNVYKDTRLSNMTAGTESFPPFASWDPKYAGEDILELGYTYRAHPNILPVESWVVVCACWMFVQHMHFQPIYTKGERDRQLPRPLHFDEWLLYKQCPATLEVVKSVRKRIKEGKLA